MLLRGFLSTISVSFFLFLNTGYRSCNENNFWRSIFDLFYRPINCPYEIVVVSLRSHSLVIHTYNINAPYQWFALSQRTQFHSLQNFFISNEVGSSNKKSPLESFQNLATIQQSRNIIAPSCRDRRLNIYYREYPLAHGPCSSGTCIQFQYRDYYLQV